MGNEEAPVTDDDVSECSPIRIRTASRQVVNGSSRKTSEEKKKTSTGEESKRERISDLQKSQKLENLRDLRK